MDIDIRNNIEIILVHPEEPGNIGSTARAMNNMGFNHLGLVNPADYKVSDTYRFAWNSHDIIDNAKVYKSLPEALEGKQFVIAMSTRMGKFRGRFEVLDQYVGEIHNMAKTCKVAILFGRESSGLLNEEIQYAQAIVRIQTAGQFSSLNLAQAVLITCYELFSSDLKHFEEMPAPASQEELEHCFKHIEQVLKKIGYGIQGDRLAPENILKNIRKVAGRALLQPREVRMIRGLCSQVEKYEQLVKKIQKIDS